MKKILFIKNAFILTATALLLRGAGMLFRVYISNRIGAEGMGLYQLIFSIHIFASTFATAGISVTVTRLITEELGRGGYGAKGILRKTAIIAATLGTAAACAVWFGAEWTAQYWLKDARAVISLKILAFSLPFMSLSSVFNGYFIAMRKISKTTAAQITEQIIRILITVGLLGICVPKGLDYACAAVIIGNTVSEIASCLFLYICYLRDKKRALHQGSAKNVFKRFGAICLPIAATGYLNSFLRTVENLLVPDSLTKYSHSREDALSQFGVLKGMAMPLLFFPSAFLSALSTLLLPEISQASAAGQNQKVCRTIRTTIQITIVLSVLIAGLFALFANELGMLIYNSAEVGFMLKIFAPVMPFMYLESVVDGMLKGLNEQVSTFKYSSIDSIIRITAIMALVPRTGMAGFLFIMICSNLFTSFLNIRRLLLVTGLKLDWKNWIFKPAVCITGSLLAVRGLLAGTQTLVYVVGGISLGSLVYLTLMLLTNGISRDMFKKAA